MFHITFRSQKAEHVMEYNINGERAAILTGSDPRPQAAVCIDGTRAYDSLGRLVLEGQWSPTKQQQCCFAILTL